MTSPERELLIFINVDRSISNSFVTGQWAHEQRIIKSSFSTTKNSRDNTSVPGEPHYNLITLPAEQQFEKQWNWSQTQPLHLPTCSQPAVRRVEVVAAAHSVFGSGVVRSLISQSVGRSHWTFIMVIRVFILGAKN